MRSLKNLFTEDDFENVDRREDAWKKAQQILDKFIEENGVKVYFRLTIDGEPVDVNRVNGMKDTHTAILIDIQPIIKCKHKEAVYVDEALPFFKCRDCGKPVKAKGWVGV